ncbi:lytic polysaccharide monooxygenase [Streptomyces sp. MB09-01]|uniref:lytic polysaccharide monooxygenase auxiliary activity family 9 protein n=1 Tax=Streptomyces sp. MB09-01 TaxID=3028666 RepID=UPI0029BD3130|nr:lytic polysaccharide monooxygenase auxiliary activity family 9 protein [Streptomyces sp. MB09-01]MDX3538123.1 lytic polysaccharide monooxygenase [Streptomyces sp. MB09-01]
MSKARTTAPSDLRADIRYRDDGKYTMYGISLRWQIGENAPDHEAWPPPADWNEGNAPYPHLYEVWLDDELRQTVFLHWSSWNWMQSNSHWVDLGDQEPTGQLHVKIRAKVDGEFTPFTNVVAIGSERVGLEKWAVRLPREKAEKAPGAVLDPRHGTANHPRSRAGAAIRDLDPSRICVEARRVNTSTEWAEVVPGADRMLADYPWNDAQKYLEYRKFFEGNTLASAGNPVFRGLDLAPDDALGDWPVTELDTSAPTQTFTYDYMAYHQGESWSHRWFITRPSWDPSEGLSWQDLEPIPFLVEVHGAPREEESTSWEFASFPRRTGRAAIVDIWGGHGGPDTPNGENGGMTGEFFLSVSDVLLR